VASCGTEPSTHQEQQIPHEPYTPFSDRSLPEPSVGARQLISALEAAKGTTGAAPSDVRDAICTYVAELKGQELAPERVLIMVKSAIAEVRGELDDSRQKLFQRVISWCIEEYYRDVS
jgi:hypothetical protein